MMKTALEKPVNLIIVSLLALIFFISTSSFNYLTQDKDYIKWSSPDETANYFFTREFAQTGQLAFFDPAGVIGNNLLMPRSVRNDFGFIKPVSFLGMILIYGYLASFLGTAIIPFLTPLFAALGLIIFYLITRRLFGNRVALWSAVLLATFPVYVYYTVRSMFHNVLFIVLLLAAVYLFMLAGRRSEAPAERWRVFKWNWPIRHWLEFLLAGGAGLFVGLAVITRTSEIIWLAPVFILILIFYGRRLGLIKIMLMVAGLLLPLIPVAYYNQILYGVFWHGGYNEMNRSLDDIAQTGGSFWSQLARGDFGAFRSYFSQVFHQVFYFGFKFDQSVLMFRHYVVDMFPELFYAGLLGLLIMVGQLFRNFQKKHLFYLLGWLILSALLVFYYGSWKFNDNPDLTHFTIGNSYTRYWLPIYLGLIPLAALALVRVTRTLCAWISRKTDGGADRLARLRFISILGLQALAVVAVSLSSIIFVLYGSEEGLSYLYYNSKQEEANTKIIWSLTPADSVIITQYSDKFFWPERRVIMGTIPANEMFAAAAKLLPFYPVYYYNFYLDATDLNYLNGRKLPPYGLEMRLLRRADLKFGLYQLEYKQSETATSSADVKASGGTQASSGVKK